MKLSFFFVIIAGLALVAACEKKAPDTPVATVAANHFKFNVTAKNFRALSWIESIYIVMFTKFNTGNCSLKLPIKLMMKPCAPA